MAKGQMAHKEVIEARQLKKFAAEGKPVYRKCFECGEQMAGRYQNYSYTQCGLSNVVLLDVLVFNCACGEIGVEIPAIALLHRFIAFELLRKPSLLSGEEVRFLRTFVGYSGTDFAERIGMTNVSVSRWEKGGRITKNTDRVLRLAFFAAIIERDAETAIGPGCETQVSAVVEFAKRVKSFDLMSFMKTIRDAEERLMIKINPTALAEFGRSEATLQGKNTSRVQ